MCVCVCVCGLCVWSVCAEVHSCEKLPEGSATSLHQRSAIVVGPVPDGFRRGWQFHSLWLRSCITGCSPGHDHGHRSVVFCLVVHDSGIASWGLMYRFGEREEDRPSGRVVFCVHDSGTAS